MATRKPINLDPETFESTDSPGALKEIFHVDDPTRIQEIDLNDIIDYPRHTYDVEFNEEMDRLIDSISYLGVTDPLTLRRVGDKYECLAGHRRKAAAKAAGLKTVPAIIKDINDKDADELMVDTNDTSRSFISTKEKARSYKLKYEAIRSNPDRKSKIFGRTIETMSTELGASSAKIARLIKIADLPDDFLKQIDKKNLTIMAAVQLAFIKENDLQKLRELFEKGYFPDEEQAKILRKLSEENSFDDDNLSSVFKINSGIDTDNKLDPIDKETAKEIARIKKFNSATRNIWPKGIEKYCPEDQKEELLKTLVTKWFEMQKQKDGEEENEV